MYVFCICDSECLKCSNWLFVDLGVERIVIRRFVGISALGTCIDLQTGWLVSLYGISTIVGYLMLNSLFTYILNIQNLAWLGFMAYQTLLVI